MEGVELKEEWQDEDFPRYVTEQPGCCVSRWPRWSCGPQRSFPVVPCATAWFSSALLWLARPLPEEEDLDEELFGGAAGDQDPGKQRD